MRVIASSQTFPLPNTFSPLQDMPRSLRLCSAGPRFYHSLDALCQVGDVQLEYIGFVH